MSLKSILIFSTSPLQVPPAGQTQKALGVAKVLLQDGGAAGVMTLPVVQLAFGNIHLRDFGAPRMKKVRTVKVERAQVKLHVAALLLAHQHQLVFVHCIASTLAEVAVDNQGIPLSLVFLRKILFV